MIKFMNLIDVSSMFQSTQAIKMLQANHRLILSGTPIQNNVLELWSLFDFLMPGLLGTEKQFTCRYSRPILASRDPKSTHKEQEAGMFLIYIQVGSIVISLLSFFLIMTSFSWHY